MIRPFDNRDVPTLARLWRQHHSRIDPASMAAAMDAETIERAIVARRGFYFGDLKLVAADDAPESAVAWMWRRGDHSAGLVVGEHATPLQLAELITAVAAPSVGWETADALLWGAPMVGRPHGIAAEDSVAIAALTVGGYSPTEESVRWQISTVGYRIPVNRDLLSLRRQTQVSFDTRLADDVESASAIAHLQRHQAVDQNALPLSEIEFYLSEPESAVMPPSMSVIEIPTAMEMNPIQFYAIANWITHVATMGVTLIQTCTRRDAKIVEGLRTIGFVPTGQGSLWRTPT